MVTRALRKGGVDQGAAYVNFKGGRLRKQLECGVKVAVKGSTQCHRKVAKYGQQRGLHVAVQSVILQQGQARAHKQTGSVSVATGHRATGSSP